MELGAGTASKTAILLDAAARLRSEVLYVPVDVSPDALEVACETIATSLPEVFSIADCSELCDASAAARILRWNNAGIIHRFEYRQLQTRRGANDSSQSEGQLQSGDALLLGVDMVKDEPTLVAAYDDRDGVTAEFNLNILHRLNRELDADFDPAKFRHRALWNPAHSRIEMHLESTCDQRVRIAAAQSRCLFRRKANAFIPRTATSSRTRPSAFFSETRALRSNRRGQTSADGIPLRSHVFGETSYG